MTNKPSVNISNFYVQGFDKVQGNRNIASIGDFNGDGHEDFSVRLIETTSYGLDMHVFLVYGTAEGFPVNFNLDNISSDGHNGLYFNIVSDIPSYPIIGIKLVSVGDVSGDGLSDIALYTSESSFVNVLYGRKGGYTSPFYLKDLNKSNSFKISPCNYVYTTIIKGDMNGDGIGDLIVSQDQGYGDTWLQYAAVIFGAPAPREDISSASLNGHNGFIIFIGKFILGTEWNTMGVADINGDGFNDWVASYSNEEADPRKFSVIYGSKKIHTEPFYVQDINGKNGFTIKSEPNIQIGSALGSVGDVNDDRVPDLYFNAMNATSGFWNCFILFGNKHGFENPFNIQTLNGKNGFVIDKCSSMHGGRLNNDTFSDLALFNGESVSVFFGKETWPAYFSSDEKNANNSIVINEIDPNKPDQNYGNQGIINIKGDPDKVAEIVFNTPNSHEFYALEFSGGTSPARPDTDHNEEHINVGLIAGLSVGAFALVGLGCVFTWYAKTHGWCAGEHNNNVYADDDALLL